MQSLRSSDPGKSAPFSGPFWAAGPDEGIAAMIDALRRYPTEVAAFAYLDPEWRILGLRHSRQGTADSILLSVRDIAADAIAFGASGVVMAHNHPSGNPTPSSADHHATRHIALVLKALHVRLIDHVIVTPTTTTSFRSAGLL